MAETQDKVFTAEEVAKHNCTDDLWVIYNGLVYDMSKYIDEHPGGDEVVLDVAGSDATEAFEDIGHSDDAREILLGLYLGKLKGGVVTVKVKKQEPAPESNAGGVSTGLIAAILVALAAGVFIYLK